MKHAIITEDFEFSLEAGFLIVMICRSVVAFLP